MKKKIILLSVILLLLFLLCYPAEALAAARNGLKLWLETLLPTLLPFMILTGILVHTDWITKILQPTAPFFKVVFGLSPGGSGAAFQMSFCCTPTPSVACGDSSPKGTPFLRR